MRSAIRISALLLLLFPGTGEVFSQDHSLVQYLARVERRYGNDADLVNGVKYHYPYHRSGGHPFLVRQSLPAEIRVRGKTFEDQQLKYDIYNQQLVLDFIDQNGAVQSLVLQSEWVESFRIGDRLFRNMEGPDGRDGYFQVIFEGKVSCYYRWTKEYLLNLNTGQQGYYFSEPDREAFLHMDGKFVEFRNNRTFRKAFERSLQRDIRQYMREEGIRIRRAGDPQMNQLMEYCNAQINDPA